MNATVVGVNPNVAKMSKAGKRYFVTEFTYQGDPSPGYPPKKPTTRAIFKSDPNSAVIAGLQAGDRVSMTFAQDEFKSLETIQKITGVAPATKSPAPYVKQQDNKDEAIARAVAFKGAIELISAMMMGGYGKLKKTMETDLYMEEVMELTKKFEPFILFKEPEELKVSDVETETQDFDQDLFDE